MESLAAILAGIRSRIAVDEQMRGEGRGALERFAALFALQVRERERRIQIWNRLNICLQRVTTHKYPEKEKEIERERDRGLCLDSLPQNETTCSNRSWQIKSQTSI